MFYRWTDVLPRTLWARVAPAEPPLKTLLGADRGAAGASTRGSTGAARMGASLRGALGVGTLRGIGVTTLGRGAGWGVTVTAGRMDAAGREGVGATRCTAC